jgi:hypothetical protein
MKKILFLLLFIPISINAQKIKGQYIGTKPNINEVTVINRGDDPLGIAEELAFEMATRGVNALTQTNFGQNTSINSESVNSKFAITFTYMYSGCGLVELNAQIYDVENKGKLIGRFTMNTFCRKKKKVIPKMIDNIL